MKGEPPGITFLNILLCSTNDKIYKKWTGEDLLKIQVILPV